MPHKLMERHHQLQAQKRHEDFLKQNVYRETAHYFQEQSVRVNHFNTWNTKCSELSHRVQENILKAKKLRLRQEKLQKLLKEEEEQYKKELLQQKSVVLKRNSTLPSLEALKQKLQEKRAEQNLYYPKTCRKINLYSSNSSNDLSLARSLNGLSINDNNSTNGSCNGSYETQRSSNDIDFIDTFSCSKPSNLSPKSPSETYQRNPRYAARYARRSLENTNVHAGCTFDNNFNETQFNKNGNGINTDEPSIDNSQTEKNFSVVESDNTDASSRKSDISIAVSNLSESEKNKNGNGVNDNSDSPLQVKEKKSNRRKVSVIFNDPTIDTSGSDSPESQKDKKISVKMFRYLKHNDLKRKILDLCKREHQACKRQCWDDALRLREMRNELILMKAKNLYDNDDLEINEENKKLGLEEISAREAQIRKRQNLKDYMYSDEARHVWKQWVLEDELMLKNHKSANRELFLKALEDEWKQLAHREKKRMSLLFDRIMTKSALQDEHQLMAIIRAANLNS